MKTILPIELLFLGFHRELLFSWGNQHNWHMPWIHPPTLVVFLEDKKSAVFPGAIQCVFPVASVWESLLETFLRSYLDRGLLTKLGEDPGV